MIYAINYKNHRLSGRVALKGERSKILIEYRMLTRAMCDYFGADTVLKWTAGRDIDITPD